MLQSIRDGGGVFYYFRRPDDTPPDGYLFDRVHVALIPSLGRDFFDEIEMCRPRKCEKLDQLNTLTRLRKLDLGFQKIDDEELGRVVKGMVELQDLLLHETQLTDKGCTYLESLTALRHLSLNGTQITSAGLLHISRLPNLKDLSLERTAVTDDGLAYLSTLPNLKALGLRETGVTDRGICHLKRIESLKILYVRDTKVTEVGKEDLLSAHPRCQIDHLISFF